MGCSGSSESKSDSNKVVPQKQQQQQKQPLSDVSSIDDDKSPKKSIDEISTDYDKYKRRREPEPKQIKGMNRFPSLFAGVTFLTKSQTANTKTGTLGLN